MGVASWVGGVRQGLSTLNLLPTPLMIERTTTRQKIEQGVHYIRNFDLLDEKIVFGARSGRASL